MVAISSVHKELTEIDANLIKAPMIMIENKIINSFDFMYEVFNIFNYIFALYK